MKPRIFVSSVTRELKSVRQLTANTLTALGYEPDWQDIFSTTGDDLREMLRRKIDGCSAVLQIVGSAYGAEPPVPDERFGRVSYTQYESLYAKSKGKKLYFLIAQPDLPRDEPPESIDAPRDASTDAQADAAERRRLQQVFCERIATTEQVTYAVRSHSEAELLIRRLRDDLSQLRRGFRTWAVGVSVALLLIVGGIFWLSRGQRQQEEQVAATKQLVQELHGLDLKPERVRERIQTMIEATYQTALKEADTLTDWKKREEAKEQSRSQRDQALSQVDEFLNSIVNTVRSGDASPEFLEFTRIFQEQGPTQALAYIATQQDRLLAEDDRIAAQQQLDRRRKLSPLLEAVQLEANEGRYAESRARCELLLKRSPDWPEALHQQFWNLTNLGSRAQRYESITAAEQYFLLAKELAERLVSGREAHPQAQRNLSISFQKLGDVSLRLGRTEEALRSYEHGLEIRKRLAAAAPHDVQVQRDLSISHNKLGDVSLQFRRTEEALGSYEQGLEISKRRATADPRDAQVQRDLSVSYDNLGDVSLRLGRTEEALLFYEQLLEISKKLAAADLRDAQVQRDLSISYDKFGDVNLQLGRTGEALRSYEQGLEIKKKLAASDPRDAQAQANLWVSLVKVCHASLQAKRVVESISRLREGEEIIERQLKIKSDFLNTYNFACYRALILLRFTLEHPEPTDAERAARAVLRKKSIEAIQALLKSGFHNMQALRDDPDFSALAGDSEFEALLRTKADTKLNGAEK